VTKKDFYESLESYFEGTNTSESFFAFDSGLRLSLSLLKELSNLSQAILETSLTSIYQTMVRTPCEQLRDVSSFDFYSREELYNECRKYLIELLKDSKASNTVKELSAKIILLIGNIRGSGEDFLIVYNLIRELGLDFNIDTELSQNKFVEIKQEGSKEGEEQLKVSYEGNKSAYILKGGDDDPDYYNPVNITMDSEYIYLYQSGKGVFKFGQSDMPSTKLGKCYGKNTGMSDEHRYLLYFDGKLYCRYSNSDRKPFTMINPETLQEITEDEEFNKKMEEHLKEEEKEEKEEDKEEDKEKEKEKEPAKPKLEWTHNEEEEDDKRNGRYLCESPLFTDGKDFYLISTMREIEIIPKEEENLDEDRKELRVKAWNLEVYDSNTWEYIKSVEIKLDVIERGIDEILSEKQEKERAMIKEVREQFESICKCNFATNGTKLLVGANHKWHIYNLETQEWTFDVPLTGDSWGYDYVTNTFWEVNSLPQVKSFKIPALGKRVLTESASVKKGIIEYLNSRAKKVRASQSIKNKLTKRTPKTLFKRLMKKEQEKELNLGETSDRTSSLFLILNILKEGAKDLEEKAEDINPQGPIDSSKLELFRGSFSTSVTSSYFCELVNSLKDCIHLIEAKKTSATILEQYNFYLLLISLKAAMMCISKLNIDLSTILYEKDDFDQFVKVFEQSVSRLVSKEHPEHVFEDCDEKEELECLWNSIETESRTIMSYCLSLVYESLEELIKKITSSLEKEEENRSLSIYIRYLTLPETMDKALRDSNTKDLVLGVYEKLCAAKTSKLISSLDSIKYEDHNLDKLRYNELEEVSEGFIYSVTQNIINHYFEAFKNKQAEESETKPDKDKLEFLENKLKLKELDLVRVLERISDSTIVVMKKC
jgi:hypothetical protein